MKRKFFLSFFMLTLIMVSISACSIWNGTTETSNITASGSISADQVDVSPEVSGKVLEVFVQEGESVNAGDPLFRIDDEILQAQYDQASAAVNLAEANVNAAQDQLSAAKLQAAQAERGARLMELQNSQSLASTWAQTVPDDFDQPNWYYQKSENLQAAQAEVDEAKIALEAEKTNLTNVLEKASSGDFLAAEERLAKARTHLLVADQTLQQTYGAQDNDTLTDMAQKEYDAALADLENAQRDYDRLLTTTAAEEVLEARAKVAVKQARYNNALNLLDSLRTGDDSLDVQTAQAAVKSAESAVAQAESGKAQTEAALRLLEIQLSKTTVKAPISGTLLTRNLQVGELVGAGSIVMTIAQLDTVELVVYIPESVYGQIELGQSVSVSVDSYPGKNYKGDVIHIADQAEFTPRNVQTVEGRQATVYAIKIRIPNPNQELKPGMPADVDFGITKP